MILLNNKRIDGVSLDTVPVGTISPFIGLVAPQGYLLCQGQKVSKNRYKQLYNICKSLFGPETETEFYLPDLRGRVVAGLNENDAAMNTIGKILGTHEHNHSTGNHTLTIDEIPSHDHAVAAVSNNHLFNTTSTWDTGSSATYDMGEFNSDGRPQHNGTSLLTAYEYRGYQGAYYGSNVGKNGAHNHGDTGLASNYQPTTVMNYIVKAEMVIPNQSTVYDGLDSDSEVDSLSAKQGKLLSDKFNNYTTTTNLPSVLDDRYLKSVQLLEPTVFIDTLSSGSAHHTFTLKDNPLNYKFLIVTTQESHNGSDVNWYGATHVIVPQYDDAPSEGERQAMFCASSIFQPGYAWYHCYSRSTDNFLCRVWTPNGTDGTEVKFRVAVFGIK